MGTYWMYLRLCVRHIFYVNSYIAESALPVQDNGVSRTPKFIFALDLEIF
jgi:hypothetical protein